MRSLGGHRCLPTSILTTGYEHVKNFLHIERILMNEYFILVNIDVLIFSICLIIISEVRYALPYWPFVLLSKKHFLKIS